MNPLHYGLRLLFEKDNTKNQQLEVLRQEVSKGFNQLESGKFLAHNVMGVFEKASQGSDAKI